jgi:hypothetical protein
VRCTLHHRREWLDGKQYRDLTNVVFIGSHQSSDRNHARRQGSRLFSDHQKESAHNGFFGDDFDEEMTPILLRSLLIMSVKDQQRNIDFFPWKMLGKEFSK